MTSQENPKKLPSYDYPPITEVACSILFSPLEELLSPHIGLLWQRFQPEYPFCDDVAPIPQRIELFDNQNLEPQLKISNIPALPRAWFISQNGDKVIQIQRDRFVYNWRKLNADSEYPRYNSLISGFQKYLKKFDDFIEEAALGEPKLLQYELTYVNQVSKGQAWSKLEEIGKVFPDVSWRANSQRFLTQPKNISWTTVFELPDKVGRLYTSVKTVTLDEKSILLFELTVRGLGSYTTREKLPNWFDIAHEWIVGAFADLTGEDTQTIVWKRRG